MTMNQNDKSLLNTSNRSSNDDEIDLLELLFGFWEKRIFISIVVFIFLCLGVAYAMLTTPIYQANTVIQVEEKTSALPGLSEVSELFGEESSAITEIELIRSRRVIGVAVEEENLDIQITPKFLPVIGKAAARYGLPINIANYATGTEILEITSLSVPEDMYGEKLELISDGGGKFRLFGSEGELILKGSEGQKVTEGDYSLFVRSLIADENATFYVTKSRRLNTILRYQKLLSVSEKGKDSGIIVLSLEDESPQKAESILSVITTAYIRQNVERQSAEAAKSLDFLHDQLPEVKQNLETAESAFNAYQVDAGSVDISAETAALLEQVVQIESDIAQLKLQKAELDRKYTKDHPTYLAWEKQLAELNQRQSELNEKIKSLPFTQQEMLGLRRDLEVSTAIYTQMISNIQELDIARAGAVGSVRLIDEAATNVEEPVKPKKEIIVVLSFLLGFLMAVGAVLVQRAFQRGVKDPDELEELGLPVYASVPLSDGQLKLDRVSKHRFRVQKISDDDHPDGLLAVSDPTDISIESLRSLRTSLHFAMMEASNNIIMISGASPSVGKSFVAGNLAALLANSEKRVLLIDGDLRKGCLHSMLGANNDQGFSEVLSNQINLGSAIQKLEVENLFLIPRGSAPPNPSELLMSQLFSSCMQKVSSTFDYVIIDSPPVLAVTDAVIVGQQCGVAFMVVRYGFNSVKEVEVACKRFAQNNVPIKGAVLNAIERNQSSYGYKYGYNYNYAYEYKTDNKTKRKK